MGKAFLAVCCITLAPLLASADAPRVLVSIQPIHSLVSGIMQGAAEPQLLLSGSQSPHHFNLRPSQALEIQRADLTIWVGPEMESTLTRPLHQRELPTVTLLDAPLLEVLPARTLQHPRQQHDPVALEVGGRDGHVWLDPHNAARIVDIITEALAELDPDNAPLYQVNALHMRQRLSALDAELEPLLSPLRERPCVVFHDSYQYLQHRYGLQNMLAVAIDPERAPGARRIRELRHWIQRAQPACIFAEPQFQPRIIAVLSEGTEMGSGVLDPLGSQLEPGADAYFQLMRDLARELANCLAPQQPTQKEIAP